MHCKRTVCFVHKLKLLSLKSFPLFKDFTDAEEEEEMTPDLIERLIPRVDDFQENMEAEIKRYNALLRRRVLVCN